MITAACEHGTFPNDCTQIDTELDGHYTGGCEVSQMVYTKVYRKKEQTLLHQEDESIFQSTFAIEIRVAIENAIRSKFEKSI